MKEALFQELRAALENFDVEAAKRAARKVIDLDINAIEAIELGLLPALRDIGNKFSSGEFFLPELMIGASIFKEAVTILEQKI